MVFFLVQRTEDITLPCVHSVVVTGGALEHSESSVIYCFGDRISKKSIRNVTISDI